MNYLKRSIELLKAVKKLLSKQEKSNYVLNLLEQTIKYDGAKCDGLCLLEDIKDLIEEVENYESNVFRIKVDEEKELIIKIIGQNKDIDIMLITKTLDKMSVMPISNNHIELKLLK